MPGANGVLQIKYSPNNQRYFGPDDWEKLKISNYDFGSIGLEVGTNSPVTGFEQFWMPNSTTSGIKK
jgi:hypothetical protein